MRHKFNLVLFIKHEVLFQVVCIASLFFLALPQKEPKRSRKFNASPHRAYARPLNFQASAQFKQSKIFLLKIPQMNQVSFFYLTAMVFHKPG